MILAHMCGELLLRFTDLDESSVLPEITHVKQSRDYSRLRSDSSEYVRKSVGNALRDISKKFPELIKIELNSWKL